MKDINHLLDTLQEGDPVAADQLLVLVYSELRRLAAAKMSREAPGILLSRKALWSARTCPRFGGRQLAAAGGAVARGRPPGRPAPRGQVLSRRKARTSPRSPKRCARNAHPPAEEMDGVLPRGAGRA